MKDCNNCLHRINETCYLIEPQFDCNLFVQFDSDAANHTIAPTMTRPPDKRELADEPLGMADIAPTVNLSPAGGGEVRLRKGQWLWYRDLTTGAIEKGKVEWAGERRFLFHFNRKEVWLDCAIVGQRLFYTRAGAEKLGRKATLSG